MARFLQYGFRQHPNLLVVLDNQNHSHWTNLALLFKPWYAYCQRCRQCPVALKAKKGAPTRLGYCILVREDFKVVIIANLLVSIDIDQDGY